MNDGIKINVSLSIKNIKYVKKDYNLNLLHAVAKMEKWKIFSNYCG